MIMPLLKFVIILFLLSVNLCFSQENYTRSFKMGVAGLVPKNNDYSQSGFNDLFDKIPDFGELFGTHATHYSPAHQFTSDSIPSPFFITFEAVQGVTKYAAVGLKPWGAMNQNDIDNYLQNHDEHFKHVVKTIAEDYEPEYLVVGIEVNHHLYRESNQFWNDFVVVYQQLYDEIKADYPQINIGTNFLLEDMRGELVMHPTSCWELINEIENKSDFVSFTTFPFLVHNHPEDIPHDYFEEINDYSSLPVIITETGWPTQPITQPDLPNISATESTQVEFIQTLIDRTCDLNDLEAIVWAFPHDATFSTESDLYNYISLRRQDGTAKPGFDFWHEITSYEINASNTICGQSLNLINSFEGKIQVYPNPASEVVVIENNHFENDINFQVLNSIGQVVETGSLHSGINHVQLDNLEKGVYILAFYHSSQTITFRHKLLKN